MASSSSSSKLPIAGRRNVLITSALSYVNNVPHLGNVIGVLSADVFARYCRLRGYNAIYMCGTNEYGTATETRAIEENCSPKEICDKYHVIHRDVYKWFDISFDHFGRTSMPEQTQVCQDIFHKLMEKNMLSENTMKQLYCDTCEKFLADRLVEGSCPEPGCNYEYARGDQCEKCAKLLDPSELNDPKCLVCQNTPRIRDTDHLFLELPLLREKLDKYMGEAYVKGAWSQNAIQVTTAWRKEGLRQRCITRDLKWGVPIPHEKYKDKVFYVWFDAPIGYISITACYTSGWEKWWKNPDNVELYQFIGKDNVPFHTVMFPSTLLGTGEKWTMMKKISVTEYLNYDTGKFSKSKGIGVFGNDAKDTNIPPEVWRYYLLTNRPEVSDTLFTWADLQAKLNGELLANLGNFINRVLSFIAKPQGAGYGSIIPDASNIESHELTVKLAEKCYPFVKEYIDAMEKVNLKQGLKAAMNISSEGNWYLQSSQFWELYNEDKKSCDIVVKTSVGLVYLLACLLEPFMPSFTDEVLNQLNLSREKNLSFSDEKGDLEKFKKPWDLLPAGHKIGQPEPLFKELNDEDVESFRQRFSCSQADRKVKQEVDAKLLADQVKATKISEGTSSSSRKEMSKGEYSNSKAAEPEANISKLEVNVGEEETRPEDEDDKILWIGNLELWMGESYLRSCFPSVNISRAWIVESRPGIPRHGFLEFSTHNDAKEIFLRNHGLEIMPRSRRVFRFRWSSRCISGDNGALDAAEFIALRCLACSDYFAKKRIKDHYEKAHPERKKFCDICLQGFEEDKYDEHMSFHQRSNNPPVPLVMDHGSLPAPSANEVANEVVGDIAGEVMVGCYVLNYLSRFFFWRQGH